MIIEGTFERLIYRNNKNSYTVARVSTEEGTMTVVGYIPMQTQGATLRLRGEMVSHDTYGEQFSVSKVLDIDVNYSNNMEAYLKSGAVSGIGPAIASRIIDKFGDGTYNIFKNEPERLMEVHGIGKITYQKIMDSFNSQADISDVMIELTKLGISPAMSTELFQKYGENVVELIKENPYRLVRENVGIGFRKSDEIAKELGIDRSDPSRIRAAGEYLVERAKGDGHTYLPLEELKKDLKSLLEIGQKELEKFFSENTMGSDIWLMNDKGEIRAYSTDLNSAEKYIGLKLKSLNNYSLARHNLDIDHYIRTIEDVDGIKLAKNQKLAIKEAFNNNIMIITGGPGTGKTTTLNAILQVASELGISYGLGAPTGRAAKKMSEATGVEATTIHRLLEYKYNGYTMEFERNEDNSLEQQMIIIDEMSMVDTYLLHALLRGIREGSRLVLLGDVDQLPSVGPGNVLSDLIKSNQIPVVKLKDIFRQEEGSHIVKNAHNINRGVAPAVNQQNSDFFMIKTDTQQRTVEIVKELVQKRLPDYYKVDPKRDIQILSPMRKGVVGVDNLNKELQGSMNPKNPFKGQLLHKGTVYRQGDKVMQNKNNYEAKWEVYTEDRVVYDSGEGIYNGDIGTIINVDEDKDTLIVDYEGREVEYKSEDLEELELAYAITVHKSQGSEFPVVIIPIHFTPYMLGNRNLVYTAITRATKLVVLVGKESRLIEMINNTYTSKRYTSLAERIQEMGWILQ